MKTHINISLILFIFFSFIKSINAQKIDGLCNNYPSFGVSVSNFSYYSYSPSLVLKNRYKTTKETKNATPEELMISIMSGYNSEWTSYNYGFEKELSANFYKRIKSQDPDKNYVELIFKIEYDHSETHYSLIKFNIYDERKDQPMSLSLTFYKKDNRWYLLDNKPDYDLDFLLMTLNQDALLSIFKNKQHKNVEFSNIIKQAWNKEYLDLSVVIKKVNDKLFNNDESIAEIFDVNNPFNSSRK